jgi:F-type H+-transporting ATPase subunit delta
MLRGYATAILESAAIAGHSRQVATDLRAFSRALVASELLRNVLTDVTIPPRTRHAIVCDLLEAKASAEAQALASWAALVEPAIDFPLAVVDLEALAEQSADAAEADKVTPIPNEELLGGRTAVRERIRGYADRLFQEVDHLERIDDIEAEVVRFGRVVDSSRDLRHAMGDPSIPVEERVRVVEDLLRGQVQPATARLVAYMIKAGHIRDLVGTLEWVAGLAAEERGRRVATVRSAVELDQAECQRLAEALERTVGHPVEIRVQVEPSLMGGMAVAIGDTVIDGSVRHRLDQLRGALVPSAASRELSPLGHESS